VSVKCKCGIKTNDPEGICAVCRVNMRVNETLNQNTGGEDMGNVTKSKSCVACGSEYKPTSNRQEYCPECKKQRARQRWKEHKRRKAAQCNTSSQSSLSVVVCVDFSEHPHLHEKLTRMAREEFRSADMQLLAILDDVFKKLEGKVATA
jgi:hypothetical protein